MNRSFRRVLFLTALTPLIASGCNSSGEDHAAKWDGKDPIAPIQIKPSSKNKNAPPKEPVKRVRGFTVPNPG